MAVRELVFEGRCFRIALAFLQAKCEIFAPNSPPVQRLYHVSSQVDLANSQLFVDAINGAPPDITLDNAHDHDALCREFRFAELGTAIAAFLTQQGPGHSDVDIAELRAAIAEQKLQHERDISWLGRQLAALGSGGDLQRDVEAVKLLTGALQGSDARQNRSIQQLMDGMRRVGAFVGEQPAALGLAETRVRTSRVESGAAGPQAAMAEDRRMVEEVRQEVAGLKAELSDCCQKVKSDLTNLEQELAKLKEEMREL
jgi:hypothetical protein